MAPMMVESGVLMGGNARAAARLATRWSAALALTALALGGCSPEARRTRDGGPGADPGNKVLVSLREPDPRAADTTLWPGRDPAPVERLAKGVIPPPAYPSPHPVPPIVRQRPITPNVPPSQPQQRSYDSGRRANPRRPSDSTR